MRALGLIAAVLSFAAGAQEDAGAHQNSSPTVLPERSRGAPATDDRPSTPLGENGLGNSPQGEREAFARKVDATGYVTLRGAFARSRIGGLIPTDSSPQFTGSIEANTQVKVQFLPNSHVYGDLSLLVQAAGNFRGTDANGNETVLPAREVPQNQPVASLNELYALHEFRPEVNLLLGKKRVVWAPGFAFNPTDIVNGRKDPTDPTTQRLGAWMAKVEVPLEKFTFTALFAPGVTRQFAGLPAQFLVYPEWDKQDDQVHYLAALRAYALLFDSDVNLFFFYGNRYGDAFEKKPRVGASFSRFFFTDYELHVEALFQSGSARDFVTPSCVQDQGAAVRCGMTGVPFVSKSQLNDPTIRPKVLVGVRRQFNDESLLSLEYLFQSDGYGPAQYQDLVRGLDLLSVARNAGLPPGQIPGASAFFGGASADGVPQRFSFDPTARHYLFASYQKPRIFDDFTAQLVVIANLQDLSTLLTPSISWSTTEWLTLGLFGFVPLPGPDALAAKTTSGRAVTEYGNLPITFRVLFEARVFY